MNYPISAMSVRCFMDQYIFMSARQIQLQSIAKSLENKILLLKEEHRILSERYEHRMRQLKQQHARVISDKQITIDFLQQQLTKDRELVVYQQASFDSVRLRQRTDIMNQLERYIGKCSELELRIQTITQKYQLKKKQIEEQNSILRDQCEASRTSRSSMEYEITKLNKFYHTSKVQQGRKQQSVQQIDLLVSLLSNFELNTGRDNKESITILTGSLQNLKQEIINPMKHLKEQDQLLVKERKGILMKIGEVIEFQNKINKESALENDKLYEHLKKERTNQQTQTINQLQHQLSKVAQHHQEELSHFTHRIKELENERKTLLLGFTQLKTLNQSREKTYREEITALKRTIEELLSGIEKRQSQFQNQVQTLHEQLTHLNQRYYENIEAPLSKLAGKLEGEVKAARGQLQKLSDNNQFTRLIQSFQLTLQKYIEERGSSSRFSEELSLYTQRAQQLSVLCKQIVMSKAERNTDHSSQDPSLAVQLRLKEVEWNEKQNKMGYQISTFKKQNKKLKQACNNFQNQLREHNGASCQKRNSKVFLGQNHHYFSEIIELQNQNQHIKALNIKYQEQFMGEVKAVRQSLRQLASKVHKPSLSQQLQTGIEQFRTLNERVAHYLQQENIHLRTVRDTTSNIDRLLIKPVQIFQSFMQRIANFYPHLNYKTPKDVQTPSAFLSLQRFQTTFQEISLRRENTSISTNRLFSQLIRTLRETTPVQIKSKGQLQQSDKIDSKGQKNKSQKQTPLQRKVRQLQTQKIKNREEVLRKLQKVEEALKGIQTKQGKRNWTSSTRIEEVLDKKIGQISEYYFSSLLKSATQFSKLTANTLKELQTKLKNCAQQNEGLIRQRECLERIGRENK